jgi:hypothetical protein
MAAAESSQEPLNISDGKDFHDEEQDDTSTLRSSFEDEVHGDLDPLLLGERKREHSRARRFVIYGISGYALLPCLDSDGSHATVFRQRPFHHRTMLIHSDAYWFLRWCSPFSTASASTSFH